MEHELMMPYEKIRIADFTTMLAGAGMCRELADLGADVIKIEPPEGDPWRTIDGPFMGVNRNKRSIVIDLLKDEAKEIAYKLISTCEVVAENSRPGIMHKLRLDYDSVKKIKPDIIYFSSTGFGTKGPDAQKPGYDPLFQALSGQMIVQGGKGHPPVFHKIALNDEMVPMMGSFGVSLALFHKLKTGHGQSISTSLLGSAVTLLSGQFINYKGIKHKYLGKPGIKGTSATSRMYQASDGKWIYIHCTNEKHWKTLCSVLGLHALPGNLRFATAGERKRHEKELSEIFQEKFLFARASEWASHLTGEGVPVAVAQDVDDLLRKDMHCKETGVFEFQQHPKVGRVQLQGVVPQFSGTPGKVRRPSPLLGQHTEEILKELGYSSIEIADFRARKLVVQAGNP
jgi:crotonobetainyl-CoA:carnitine CoA-transferase CaiB-like acyl-CoA transferase